MYKELSLQRDLDRGRTLTNLQNAIHSISINKKGKQMFWQKINKIFFLFFIGYFGKKFLFSCKIEIPFRICLVEAMP